MSLLSKLWRSSGERNAESTKNSPTGNVKTQGVRYGRHDRSTASDAVGRNSRAPNSKNSELEDDKVNKKHSARYVRSRSLSPTKGIPAQRQHYIENTSTRRYNRNALKESSSRLDNSKQLSTTFIQSKSGSNDAGCRKLVPSKRFVSPAGDSDPKYKHPLRSVSSGRMTSPHNLTQTSKTLSNGNPRSKSSPSLQNVVLISKKSSQSSVSAERRPTSQLKNKANCLSASPINETPRKPTNYASKKVLFKNYLLRSKAVSPTHVTSSNNGNRTHHHSHRLTSVQRPSNGHIHQPMLYGNRDISKKSNLKVKLKHLTIPPQVMFFHGKADLPTEGTSGRRCRSLPENLNNQGMYNPKLSLHHHSEERFIETSAQENSGIKIPERSISTGHTSANLSKLDEISPNHGKSSHQLQFSDQRFTENSGHENNSIKIPERTSCTGRTSVNSSKQQFSDKCLIESSAEGDVKLHERTRSGHASVNDKYSHQLHNSNSKYFIESSAQENNDVKSSHQENNVKIPKRSSRIAHSPLNSSTEGSASDLQMSTKFIGASGKANTVNSSMLDSSSCKLHDISVDTSADFGNTSQNLEHSRTEDQRSNSNKSTHDSSILLPNSEKSYILQQTLDTDTSGEVIEDDLIISRSTSSFCHLSDTDPLTVANDSSIRSPLQSPDPNTWIYPTILNPNRATSPEVVWNPCYLPDDDRSSNQVVKSGYRLRSSNQVIGHRILSSSSTFENIEVLQSNCEITIKEERQHKTSKIFVGHQIIQQKKDVAREASKEKIQPDSQSSKSDGINALQKLTTQRMNTRFGNIRKRSRTHEKDKRMEYYDEVDAEGVSVNEAELKRVFKPRDVPMVEQKHSKNIGGFASPPVQRRLKGKKPMRMHQLGRNIQKIMPRIPRPQRTQLILDSLKTGLKESITNSQGKLESVKVCQVDTKSTISSRQGFHYNLDKQIKNTERYIRKLQFHLTKVEELQEHYEKELKVREGAVNMVRAYSDHARKKKEPVNEAKSGVKDCTQALCYMEAELEANLGMFMIKIEGIAGFARVCRGDIFEITFKYGQQKWKSKCKVEKDLSQSWEHDEIVLFPLIGEFLTVKVTEMRGIARSNMIIGNLEFDTSDFYQAESQTLTIDVNENGTIKMNMSVSWCPFQTPDEEQVRSPVGSYGRRERSYTQSSGGQPAENKRSHSMEEKVISQTANRPKSRHFDIHTAPILTLEEALHNVCRLLEILNGQYTELKDLDMQVGNLDSILKKKKEDIKNETEASMSIKNALDSFDFLDDIDEGLSDPDHVYSSDDHSSISEDIPPFPVETKKLNSEEIMTLGCNNININETDASLLNKQNYITDSQNKMDNNRNSYRPTSIHNHVDNNATGDVLPSVDKTNKLSAWSGQRESLFMEFMEKRDSWLFDGNFRASRLFEMSEQRDQCRLIDTCDDALGKSNTSLAHLTTGDDGIDQTLVQHLQFIEYLLTHLGAFGPLKVKETIALEKLQKQASILLQLNTLVDNKTKVLTPESVYPDLKLSSELVYFWECCSEKEVLYVNTDSFLLHLDVKFGAKLRTNHPDIADRVFQNLTQQIIERPVNLLNPRTVMTLFQYVSFFTEEERKSPEKYVADITNEYELTANLHPANPDLPKVLKKLPRGVLLPAGNLQALGILLLESSATFQTGVRMYLESINQNEQIRRKVINIFLECLEERDQSMRQAGCAALAAMKASEALDQLVYLLRCDVDDVKTTAKEALEAFGDEGHEAFERVAFPYFGSSVAHYPVDVPLMTTEL